MPLASCMQGVNVKTVGNVIDSGKSNSLTRFPMHDDRRMYMNMYLYAHMYRNIVFLPDCGKQIISCMYAHVLIPFSIYILIHIFKNSPNSCSSMYAGRYHSQAYWSTICRSDPDSC